MADKKRNALAELAEILKCHCPLDDDFYPSVQKAQRICKVLGMVCSNERGKPWLGESVEAVEKCRAIAKEGAK